MWARLFLIALAMGRTYAASSASTTSSYYPVVWCNYNGDFATACSNINTELTQLVNTRLQAVYNNYPTIDAPYTWTKYDEKRRRLRGEQAQSERELPPICPLQNCLSGGYNAQQCSYFCGGGRRRDLDESTTEEDPKEENHDHQNDVRQLDGDYSASLTTALKNAVTQAYQDEVKTSKMASSTCKSILSQAVCGASVTTY